MDRRVVWLLAAALVLVCSGVVLALAPPLPTSVLVFVKNPPAVPNFVQLEGDEVAGAEVHFNPTTRRIFLKAPASGTDVYAVEEEDGYRLHPLARSPSHSLRIKLTTGPFFDGFSSVTKVVEKMTVEVKPIHVTFEDFLYEITFPTINVRPLVSLTEVNLWEAVIEVMPYFDVSPADVEPLDTPVVDLY